MVIYDYKNKPSEVRISTDDILYISVINTFLLMTTFAKNVDRD